MPEPRIHAVLHGHFYQPPRENPWTGEVPIEHAARPFRDWNSRIAAECYAANAFARIGDSAGRCVSGVNNYEHLSFNFGPTLLCWLRGRPRRTKAGGVRFTLADLSPEDQEEVLDKEAASPLRTGAELGFTPGIVRAGTFSLQESAR